MPTLTPESRYSNMERSLEAYITAHIVTGLGVPVIFPEHAQLTEVVNGTVSRWGDVSYIGLDPRLGPMNKGNSRVTIGRMTLNANLFQLRDHFVRGVAGVTEYSLMQLAAQVCELFPATYGIPIYDYDTVDTPRVGAFEVLEEPVPKRIAEEPYTQINISVPLQYISEVNL